MLSVVTRLWILAGLAAYQGLMCYLAPSAIGPWVGLAFTIFCLLWILTRNFHRW